VFYDYLYSFSDTSGSWSKIVRLLFAKISWGPIGPFTVAIDRSGSVRVWDSQVSALTNVPASATNVIEAAAGVSYVIAVTGDGRPRFFGPATWSDRVSAGDNLPLMAHAGGAGILSYQWFANGIPLPGETSARPVIRATLEHPEMRISVIVSNHYSVGHEHVFASGGPARARRQQAARKSFRSPS